MPIITSAIKIIPINTAIVAIVYNYLIIGTNSTI